MLMLRPLWHILLAMTGLMFCWLVLAVAAFDAIGVDRYGDRQSYAACLRKEWGRWWDVYDDLRA